MASKVFLHIQWLNVGERYSRKYFNIQRDFDSMKEAIAQINKLAGNPGFEVLAIEIGQESGKQDDLFEGRNSWPQK